MRPDTFGLFEAVEKLMQETTPALYTCGNARKKAGSFIAGGLNMYAEFTAAFQSAQILFDLVKATQGLSNSNEVLAAVNDTQLKLRSAIASALASQ
jgi:hypothetical protein